MHHGFQFHQVVPREWGQAVEIRGEAECRRQFQEEVQVEVREIRLERIQDENRLPAQVIYAIVPSGLFHGLEQDFAHEHCDAVLLQVAAYPDQGRAYAEIPCMPQGRPGVHRHIGLQDVHGLEIAVVPLCADHEPDPSPLLGQAVKDYRIFPESGDIQDNEFRVNSHFICPGGRLPWRAVRSLCVKWHSCPLQGFPQG